LDYQQMVG